MPGRTKGSPPGRQSTCPRRTWLVTVEWHRRAGVDRDRLRRHLTVSIARSRQPTLVEFRLVILPAILREPHDVLTGSNFRYPDAVAGEIGAALREIADLAEPATRLSVIARDPADDHVLECAVESRAAVVVSKDRDLLALRRCGEMPVCRPQEFLAR